MESPKLTNRMTTFYYDSKEDKFKHFVVGSTPITYLTYIMNKKNSQPTEDKKNYGKRILISDDPNYISDRKTIIDDMMIDKYVAKKFIIDFENVDIKITKNLAHAIDNYDAKKMDCYSLLSLLPDLDLKIYTIEIFFEKEIYYVATKIIDDVENGIFTYFEDGYYETNLMINQLIFYLLFMRNDMEMLDIFLNFMEFKSEFIIPDTIDIKNYLTIEQFEKILSCQQKNIESNYLEFTKELLPKFGIKIVDIVVDFGIKFLPSDNIFSNKCIISKSDCEYFISNEIGTDHLVRSIMTEYNPNKYSMIPWLIENGCKPISDAPELNSLIESLNDYNSTNISFEMVKEIIDLHIEKVKDFDTSEIYLIGFLCIELGKSLGDFIDILSTYRLYLISPIYYMKLITTVEVMYIWASFKKNEEIFNYLLDKCTSCSYIELIIFISNHNTYINSTDDKIMIIINKAFENITIDNVWDDVCDTIEEHNICDPFEKRYFLYYFRKYLRNEHLETLYRRCIDFSRFLGTKFIYNYFENGYSDIVKKYSDVSIMLAIDNGDIKIFEAIFELSDPSEWINDAIIESYIRKFKNEKDSFFILWCKDNILERFNNILNKIVDEDKLFDHCDDFYDDCCDDDD